MIREMTRQGFSVSGLFDGTDLSLERLAVQDQVPSRDYESIVSNAMEVVVDPAWALKFNARAPSIGAGLLGAAASRAPTLRSGLRLFETFYRVMHHSMSFSLRSQLDGLIFCVQLELSDRSKLPVHVEGILIGIKKYIELMDGNPLVNSEFHFAYPAPSYEDQYHEVFQNQVVFDAKESALVIRGLDYDSPLPFYDKELWELAQVRLAEALKVLHFEKSSPYTKHVLAYFRSLEPPLPDLASVADHMHISKRTLNRRLSDEGTSFKEIRSQELLFWAKRYLVNTNLTIEALGVMLGYQDDANFRRAFKAKVGCSPSAYRLGYHCR
jgi:AraC-like DNA-binding protein